MRLLTWIFIISTLYGTQKNVYGYQRSDEAPDVIVSEDEQQNKLKERSTEVVDKILEAYKVAIIASGNSKGEIKINDIEKTFTLNFLKARFRGTDGHLKNVLTVQRTSPASVEQDANTEVISIKSSIGFEYLKIEFDRFVIDMPVMKSLEAKIEAVVQNCVFEVNIEVTLGVPCSAQLTGLQIIEFSNITSSVSGLRWKMLSTIAGKIVEAFTDEFAESSKSFLENYFQENLKEAVELADVCSIMEG